MDSRSKNTLCRLPQQASLAQLVAFRAWEATAQVRTREVSFCEIPPLPHLPNPPRAGRSRRFLPQGWQPGRTSKGLELELFAHLQAETATSTPPRPNSRGTTDDARRPRLSSQGTTAGDDCCGLTAKARRHDGGRPRPPPRETRGPNDHDTAPNEAKHPAWEAGQGGAGAAPCLASGDER